MSMVTMPQKPKTALPDEFESLYREHATFVYRTAFRITRNAEESEDILQTIFLRLMRRECPPDFLKRPKAYLYRAAVNAALDAIQLRSNRSAFTDVNDIETILHKPDSSSKERLHRQLHKAIAELNPTSAEILILRYMHNYSDAEIAKMLGKSRGVVAVTLYRSRARLKRLIRQFQGDES